MLSFFKKLIDSKHSEKEKAISKAIEIIKEFEGLELYSYICPGGYKTIGYGTRLSKDIKEPISEKKANKWLKKEVQSIYEFLLEEIKTTLTPNQYSALISLVYNIGRGAFNRSKLKKYIQIRRLDLAGKEFDWIKSNGIILNGLVIRRKKEATLFNGMK